MCIKVSLIVTAYNLEKYISDCLNTLVNQSLQDIEIIVVNDCSIDATGDIIDSFAKKYENITSIHNEENLGSLPSIINCSKLAQGEFIAQLDGDDLYEKDMFYNMYHIATHNNLDVVECNGDSFIDISNEIVINHQFDRGKIELTGDDIFEAFIKKDIVDMQTTKLIRMDLWRKISLYLPFKRLRSDDTVIIFLLSYFAETYKRIEDKYFHYRQRDNSSYYSQTPENIALKIESYLFNAKFFRSFLNENGFKNIDNDLLDVFIQDSFSNVFYFLLDTNYSKHPQVVEAFNANFRNIELYDFFKIIGKMIDEHAMIINKQEYDTVNKQKSSIQMIKDIVRKIYNKLFS